MSEEIGRQDDPDILWGYIYAKDRKIAELEKELNIVRDFAKLLKSMTDD